MNELKDAKLMVALIEDLQIIRPNVTLNFRYMLDYCTIGDVAIEIADKFLKSLDFIFYIPSEDFYTRTDDTYGGFARVFKTAIRGPNFEDYCKKYVPLYFADHANDSLVSQPADSKTTTSVDLSPIEVPKDIVQIATRIEERAAEKEVAEASPSPTRGFGR